MSTQGSEDGTGKRGTRLGDDAKRLSRDERALTSYLDGELTERQRRQFERRLATDPALARELERQRTLAKELRMYIERQVPRDDQLWARIESRLGAAPGIDTAAAGGRRMFEGLAEALERMRAFVSPQTAGAFAFAAVVLLLLNLPNNSGEAPSASGSLTSGPTTSGTAQQGLLVRDESPRPQTIASTQQSRPQVRRFAAAGSIQSPRIDTSQLDSLQSDPMLERERVKLAGRSLDEWFGLEESQQAFSLDGAQSKIPTVFLTSGSREGSRVRRPSPTDTPRDAALSRRRSGPRLATEQLIGADEIVGGFRTDGLDIEWIKTDRPVKIVPSYGRKAPPVIWVGPETER